jgi:hypothetical protein
MSNDHDSVPAGEDQTPKIEDIPYEKYWDEPVFYLPRPKPVEGWDIP